METEPEGRNLCVLLVTASTLSDISINGTGCNYSTNTDLLPSPQTWSVVCSWLRNLLKTVAFRTVLSEVMKISQYLEGLKL